MRRVSPWAFLALILFVIPLAALALEVTNVKAGQRTGTKQVDITYDLTTDDGNPVAIQVAISDDGGATFNVKAQTFSGDVGPSVLGGVGRRIVWDAGKDVPNVSGTRYMAKVTATAGGTAANGRVWFLTPKTAGGSDNEIWSMEPDGSDASKAVELPFGNSIGAFAISPDGTEIAFVHKEEYSTYKLKLRKVAGGLTSEIYDFGASVATVKWLPDGNSLASIVDQGYSAQALVVLDMRSLSVSFSSSLPQQGDVNTQVGSLGALIGVDWVSDGSKVFVTGSSSSYYDFGSIYTMKPDYTGLQLVSKATDCGPVAVSPDGASIAYAREDKGIFLARSDGTRETRLASQIGYGVTWSPDGREIFFEDQGVVSYPAVQKLYKVKTDGTGFETVTPKGTGRFAPWNPVWAKR